MDFCDKPYAPILKEDFLIIVAIRETCEYVLKPSYSDINGEFTFYCQCEFRLVFRPQRG